MPPKKIYFASDIHLGNRYLENPADTEKKLVRWLDGIKTDAIAVYFLGDVFDYWYEYKYVVPRGQIRFLGKLAELSDLGIEIHLFTGNHDIWMFDYFTKEFGAVIHREPLTVDLLGKNFFLGHGDEVGRRPPGYRILQALFRNRLCQILYAAVHPRWTFGFARRWSLSSRKNGLTPEKLKEAQARNTKALEEFARSHLRTHPGINFFLFGHLHLLADTALTPESRLLIIGDWMHHFSYAEWNGKKLELKQFRDIPL
ncbi:MAG: UDP-2,3-diacylglucosamine diphosphatase [Tannerella sp.]|jgi:UDP-2,3-diacylglucosamine hydrolase|nr:UDP-2,3-diacylglucosamine diphosphatase [Tannerella sp.]